MMISAFFKAIGQLLDPKFQKVLWLGILLSLFALTLLVAGTDYYLSTLDLEGAEWWWAPLRWLADWGAAAWIIAWFFLFPPVTITFMGMFLDDVCAAVEDKHYPTDPPGQELSILDGFLAALKLGALILTVNILIFPLVILLMFIPPAGLVLYYAVNGYFIGREYFELVSWRHIDRPAAQRLRKRNGMRILLAGAVLAFLFTIPILNLLTPLIAAALMMHVFKGLQQQEMAYA